MRYGEHREYRPGQAALLVVVIGVLAVAGVQAQEECQVPLFVKSAGGGANVMIMADNSGSMNQIITHEDYDRDVEWLGVFNSGSIYFVAKAGPREPNDFYYAWASSPTVNLAISDNGEDGRYPGNYLNWLYFHATDDQRISAPTWTRIQVLKAVLYDVVDISDQLRFGVTVFNGENGGNIIGNVDKNHTAVQAVILGITANTWTPLGEAMEDILDYFSLAGPSAPIIAGCEYNFCLVVTDGFPTMDTDVSLYLHDADRDGNDPGNCASIGAPYPETNFCSDHFDDVTYYAAHNDLRPDLAEDQFLNTYVIGFDIDADILPEAAMNGDGLYFPASNAVELWSSIQFALQDILRRISSGSAVAVVSTETGTDDRLYRGKFMPVDWNGYLECFHLPYEDGDHPLWDAGAILEERGPASRSIFTALGEKEIDFNTSGASVLMPYLGAADANEAEALIRWGRGETVIQYRWRQGRILGDIIHATPVVVGPPAGFHATEEFQTFADNLRNRSKQVYIGANDGMLHSFDGQTGNETWAFVPEFALPMFSVMADSGYCHRYTCDQTVAVKDIQVNGIWRTILSSGGGRGGSSIFTMDVTDPYNPDVLWQQQLPDNLTGHSEVQIATIGGHAVALVGSGYVESKAAEASIYAYDLADGTLLGALPLSMISGRNKASRPEIVDRELDGNTDLVYVSDMTGSLWRIDVEGSPYPANWSVTKLFDSILEITADPVAAYGENGEIYVYFGTGAYLNDADLMTVADNYFVCVFDDHSLGTATIKSMADQTTKLNSVDGETGWFIELVKDPFERVTERASVVAQEVIFTSFAPNGEVCMSGGHSWLYQAKYDTGGGAGKDNEDNLDGRIIDLGDGIGSYPVVDIATGTVVVQSSDASIKVNDVASIYQRLTVRSWQETYKHVEGVVQTQ